MGSGRGTADGRRAAPVGEDLRARSVAARLLARTTVATSLALLAAARTTLEGSARVMAHALPDIGPTTPVKGVTLCELLAGDEVVVVPDLRWDDVLEPYRCPDCTRVALSAAWPPSG